MAITTAEAMQFVEEHDVKFVRLTFCDLFGIQKNIAILSSQLERAFLRGVPFDAAAIPGFGELTGTDLLLFPDPDTLALLPWRPAQGRVARLYCHLRSPAGEDFVGDSRRVLAQAAGALRDRGYWVRMGVQCEFYLFAADEAGRPTLTPHDRAGYLDVAPADRGENVRREVCLTLEEMGIAPESSRHQRGPGQNEIDFCPDAPLTAIDHCLSLRMVVKAIATRSGLYASFLPKPLAEECGSGLCLSIALSRQGRDLFGGAPCPEADAFLAGVARRLPELSVLLDPLPGSYRRLDGLAAGGAGREGGRCQPLRMVRLPGEPGRLEVRSPDPACNPYLAAALLLAAGLEGMEEGLPPFSGKAPRLPGSLGEALELARAGDFLPRALPPAVAEVFLAHKARQWEEYRHAQNQQYWELERFLGVV